MKKIALLSGILFLSTLAYSQVEIRPYLGFNFSNVSKTPDGTSTQAKVGGQIGASLMIGDRFHLNPGIAYFSRSTEFSSKDDPNISSDLLINGVSIPLLVGYRFVDPSSEPLLNVRVYAGPSLMFLTKNELSGADDNAINWNDTQWGGQVGAGLDILIFFLDLSYEFGLTNTIDGTDNNTIDDFTDIKNNTFYVNAGFRLSFSR